MKRIIAILGLLFSLSGLYAQQVSLGGTLGYLHKTQIRSQHIMNVSAENRRTMSSLYLGIMADFTYLNVSTGLSMANQLESISHADGFQAVNEAIEGNFSYFHIQVLGKFPFGNGSLRFFPTAGLEGHYEVENTISNDIERIEILQLYVKAGAGLDFHLSDSILLQPMALLGYKIPGKLEDYWADLNYMADSSSIHSYEVALIFNVGFKL